MYIIMIIQSVYTLYIVQAVVVGAGNLLRNDVAYSCFRWVSPARKNRLIDIVSFGELIISNPLIFRNRSLENE